VLAALVLAIVPATARAGTYDVRLCADPQATGFVERNDAPATLTTAASCPAKVGDPISGVYAGVTPGITGMVAGATASWTVTAPAGTTLRSLTARHRFAKADPNYEVAVVNAEGAVLDGCAFAVACTEEVATRTYGATRAMTFRVRCVAAVCANSTLGTRAWVLVDEASATIEDPAAPVMSAPSTAAGWQRSADVPLAAEDASGIAALTLRVGAQTLAARPQSCDYRHLQPCPGSVTLTVPADLPDGTHTLTAVATDAAGQSTTSAPATLRLDRHAPASPQDVAVRATGTGTYLYTWRNPAQGDAAPIAAAHLSDGTVVRAAGVQQLEGPTADGIVYLEDEAGNADPATAVGVGTGATVGVQRPILQTTASPKIKFTSARRNGTRLIVRGTVSNATTAKVTATVSRGRRSVRKSATLKRGRFTISVPLSATLRRKGTVTLTVRHGAAKASKRIRF